MMEASHRTAAPRCAAYFTLRRVRDAASGSIQHCKASTPWMRLAVSNLGGSNAVEASRQTRSIPQDFDRSIGFRQQTSRSAGLPSDAACACPGGSLLRVRLPAKPHESIRAMELQSVFAEASNRMRLLQRVSERHATALELRLRSGPAYEAVGVVDGASDVRRPDIIRCRGSPHYDKNCTLTDYNRLVWVF